MGLVYKAVMRPTCPRCTRPQITCICRWITPTPHQVEVLLLQHPLEVNHAKGSARLLHLSLSVSGSRLVVGEQFDPATLQALLFAPLLPHSEPRTPVLLYPETPDYPATTLAAERLTTPETLRLIVLDGTWRKSRKMLHLNPALQQLPRVALSPAAASRYRIRRAQRPEQLSTLEATVAALSQLERTSARFEPLLSAFDGFVAQQLAVAVRGAGICAETSADPMNVN